MLLRALIPTTTLEEAFPACLRTSTDNPEKSPSTATVQRKPFHTTSPHGTGLGLYIARELCLANQATLDYVPLPGGGACFRVRLVAAGSQALAAP